MDRTTKGMATPAYTDPIWLMSKHCGNFSDIYGIGLTMLAFLSGSEAPHAIHAVLENIYEDKQYDKLDVFLEDKWPKEV